MSNDSFSGVDELILWLACQPKRNSLSPRMGSTDAPTANPRPLLFGIDRSSKRIIPVPFPLHCLHIL